MSDHAELLKKLGIQQGTTSLIISNPRIGDLAEGRQGAEPQSPSGPTQDALPDEQSTAAEPSTARDSPPS